MDNKPEIHIFKKTNPKEEIFSDYYGGTEVRFRNFLHHYSQISIDLLDFDLNYSRQLVAIYRFEYSVNKTPSRSLFEPALEKHSEYYTSLLLKEKEQVLQDLDFWHPNSDCPSSSLAASAFLAF